MSGYPLIRPDAGRAEVDLILNGMECQIYDVYRQAAVEMRKKAENYLAFYALTEREKFARMEAGEITQAEYRQWCISHMLTGRRYYEMSEVLATDMTNYDKIAASIMNGHLPDVYACGYNYALYQAEIAGGFQTTFSLYDRSTVERLLRDEPDLLPIQPKVNVRKDMRWNKKQIASSMMQSILQGESVPQIAARMSKHCSEMSTSTAVRSARTAVTAAENGGRNDRYKQLREAGVDLEIEWSATLDSRTRMSHRELDGQRRAPDKPFYVDGVEVEYPGDPRAPQYLIWNCRCTMLAWVKGFAPSEVVKTSPKLDVSYEEWKAGKPTYETTKGKSGGRGYRVNPDNPSYGYSGRNSARIKPDTYGYTAEMHTKPEPTSSAYQKKGLTTAVGSGRMETEGIVEDNKISGFFLNPESKHGNEFLSVGYSADRPDVLRNDLLEALRTCERIPEKATAYGERFSMDAMLGVTKRRNFQLIWQVDKSTGIPRIITGHRRKEGRT